MRQGYHLLLFGSIVGFKDELDVYGVGVPDRDADLEPAECDLPSAPEWIWTNLKLAKMLLHFTPMLTR